MLTNKQIKLLKKSLQILESNYNLDPFIDDIDTNTEYLNLPFPQEDENEFEVDDLLVYFEDLDSLKIHDFNKVTTDRITQRVVTPSKVLPIFYIGANPSTTKNDISLEIVYCPLLIGIAASFKKEYDDYHPPCSSHFAVEIIYPNKDARLSEEEEEKLIKAYFFELSHVYKVAFSFSTYRQKADTSSDEIHEHLKNFYVNKAEDYNPGMDLFIQANQQLSTDLKFLSYYKVFEFFAPFYSKIDAFDAMRKKLDSSNSISLSSQFISSIFDLVKNYERNIRDKELVKALIDNTFDLVDIYDSLPLSIRSAMKVEKLEYKTKKEVKDRIINYLGNVLYSTRNEIVHAKSNFEPTGIECSRDDLHQFNEFMHKACYSTIKWYNRLPEHLKIK